MEQFKTYALIIELMLVFISFGVIIAGVEVGMLISFIVAYATKQSLFSTHPSTNERIEELKQEMRRY